MALHSAKQGVVCVTGWHFHEPFYERLAQVDSVDIVVVSHKPWEQVPEAIRRHFGRERLWCLPNRGYDWGCYEQFLRTPAWRSYPYVFFIHDDVQLKDTALFDASVDLLKQHVVVGNGRISPRGDIPQTHPQSYAHSSWKPPHREYQHTCVRGSYFATTREALDRLQSFEVFWDPFHLGAALGNWSTRASCGKWQELYGDNCFGFLSETYRESPFLLEDERGGVGVAGAHSASRWKSVRWERVVKVSSKYMEHYWRKDSTYYRVRPLVVAWLVAQVRLFSGSPGAWQIGGKPGDRVFKP